MQSTQLKYALGILEILKLKMLRKQIGGKVGSIKLPKGKICLHLPGF